MTRCASTASTCLVVSIWRQRVKNAISGSL